MVTEDNNARYLREFEFLFKDGSFRFGVQPSADDGEDFELHIHDEENSKCCLLVSFQSFFVSFFPVSLVSLFSFFFSFFSVSLVSLLSFFVSFFSVSLVSLLSFFVSFFSVSLVSLLSLFVLILSLFYCFSVNLFCFLSFFVLYLFCCFNDKWQLYVKWK